MPLPLALFLITACLLASLAEYIAGEMESARKLDELDNPK